MATLGEYHRRTRLAIAPITTHVTVTVMHVAHALHVVDIHDLAHAILVNELLEQAKKRREAQHVAHDDVYALFVRRHGDTVTFLWRGGGGLFKHDTPVYGMSVGGMVHQKEIHGLSVAGIHAFTKRKSGLSFSFMDVCKESRGASFFAAGGAERNYGFAAGFVNLAEHNSGMQLGVVNQVMPDAVIENNYSAPEKPEGFGVQAGIINYSEGKGLQFGLWNTNTNAWIKHFPFFNFAL